MDPSAEEELSMFLQELRASVKGPVFTRTDSEYVL